MHSIERSSGRKFVGNKMRSRSNSQMEPPDGLSKDDQFEEILKIQKTSGGLSYDRDMTVRWPMHAICGPRKKQKTKGKIMKLIPLSLIMIEMIVIPQTLSGRLSPSKE